jgi:hypothetical protein
MRTALFISHANPEDNAFAMWLGAKLSAMGYDVWADVLKLKGGQDWQRQLEEALREKSRKVLVVASPHSVAKQGVRNEIQIAHNVGQSIEDKQFIIPLRLAPFDAPFLIAHLQYIDFSAGWTAGLKELLDTLENTYQVSKTTSTTTQFWRDAHLRYSGTLLLEDETLTSNWLSIERVPRIVRYCDFKPGISIGHSQARIRSSQVPLVPFRRGFLTFEDMDELQAHFGSELPITAIDELGTDHFLAQGWQAHGIQDYVARNHFVDLCRQALDNFFRANRLAKFVMSNGRSVWWTPVGIRSEGFIAFDWNKTISGRRQIIGFSKKRKLFWHFGVSALARHWPIRHVRFRAHLIFTEDGRTPIYEARKMHRLRRSFAKSWRNARWRDMLLAFLSSVSTDKEAIVIPMSSRESLHLTLPPITFRSPVSMVGGEPPISEDQDDPDIPDSVEIPDGDDLDEVETDYNSDGKMMA